MSAKLVCGLAHIPVYVYGMRWQQATAAANRPNKESVHACALADIFMYL